MDSYDNKKSQDIKKVLVPIIIVIALVIVAAVILLVIFTNKSKENQVSLSSQYTALTEYNRTLEDLKSDADEKLVYSDIKDDYRNVEDKINQLRTALDNNETENLETMKKDIEDALEDLEDEIEDKSEQSQEKAANNSDIYDSYSDRYNTISKSAKSKKVASQSKVKKAKESAKSALESFHDAISNKQAASMEQLKVNETIVDKAKAKKKKSTTNTVLPGVTSGRQVFSGSDTYVMSESIYAYTLPYDWEYCALAILGKNEIYARYGVHFNTSSLSSFFKTWTTWYSDNGISSGSITLNSTEKENVKQFQSIIDNYVNQGYTTGKASDFSYEEYVEAANDWVNAY
jgi:flagellar basal body-associated protein FliL